MKKQWKIVWSMIVVIGLLAGCSGGSGGSSGGEASGGKTVLTFWGDWAEKGRNRSKRWWMPLINPKIKSR
ncbi:Uncharacterised protein [Actinobacillus pleuropneumoniae]|nr:Uncharacterised protein [Actinobacillus pleuropneumoniae]